MSNNVAPKVLKSSYGEQVVVQPSPKVQISAVYGLLDDVITISDLVSSGTAVSLDSMFVADSGTDPAGLAAILSKKQVQSRAGVGAIGRFDAKFSTPMPDSRQAAGLQNSEDGAVFAYFGESFGIIYYCCGKDEAQELTITTPAGGVENATVTVDGVGYTVPLTAGDANHTATEIATSLTAQNKNYLFSANTTDAVSTVFAQSNLSGAAGAFAFTSATAVAAWSQEVAGEAPVSTFQAQPQWNVDNADWLDTLKVNYYQVAFNGNLEFSIFNPDEDVNDYVVVHRISNANNSDSVLFGNPTFRIGWSVQNFGNTNSISVSGGQAALLDEGLSAAPVSPITTFNEVTTSTTEQTILTVRNRFHFNGRYNRANIDLKTLIASTETIKIAKLKIVKNPEFVSDMVFEYPAEGLSTAEMSFTQSEITGGVDVATIIVKQTNPEIIAGADLVVSILPGETYTITGEVSSGNSALTQVSIIAEELF